MQSYPDLKTCQEIGGEFPDSEFVYLDDPRGFCTGGCDVMSRKDATDLIKFVENNFPGHLVKIVASAPNCEELDMFLYKNNAQVVVYQGEFVLADFNLNPRCDHQELESRNIYQPEQARAEAVSLILKNI